MEQETMAAQTIETVGTDVLYDESVKRLLANKSILAVILKECVPEFKHCTTREIAEQYIEGEPQIGEVGIAPDETNRSGEVIHGLLDRPLVDLLFAPPVLPMEVDTGVEVDAHDNRRQGQIGQMDVGMGDSPVIAHHEPHQHQQGEQQRGVGHGAPFRTPVGRTEHQQGDLRQAAQPR